jgi:hypothetical protein
MILIFRFQQSTNGIEMLSIFKNLGYYGLKKTVSKKVTKRVSRAIIHRTLCSSMVLCAVLPKLWLLGTMMCLYNVRVASRQYGGRGTWGVWEGAVEGCARWLWCFVLGFGLVRHGYVHESRKILLEKSFKVLHFQSYCTFCCRVTSVINSSNRIQLVLVV